MDVLARLDGAGGVQRRRDVPEESGDIALIAPDPQDDRRDLLRERRGLVEQRRQVVVEQGPERRQAGLRPLRELAEADEEVLEARRHLRDVLQVRAQQPG
jgi:hypothetical protein